MVREGGGSRSLGLDRDYERYCELTSSEERGGLTDQRTISLPACIEAARRRGRERTITERQRSAVDRVEVVKVRVYGHRGEANLQLDDCTSWGSKFRRAESGQWQYDGPLPTGPEDCAADLKR